MARGFLSRNGPKANPIRPIRPVRPMSRSKVSWLLPLALILAAIPALSYNEDGEGGFSESIALAAASPGVPAPVKKRANPSETAFTGGQNILTNGGFEDGAKGWRLPNGMQIVSGQGVAHSGAACAMGEATKDKQAIQLVRTIPVKEGWRYRFDLWTRATNGAKMTVFVIQPGAKPGEKARAGDLKNVPAKWRLFEGTFTASATGNLDLQINAPASYGAPTGKMWVDDVAVFEYPILEASCVSKGKGFNDTPSMARSSDGSLYLSWISFRDGVDTLQVARLVPEGGGFKETGAWQIAGGKNSYIFAPRITEAGDKAFVVYASEVQGNWDIFAAACGPEGPQPPIRVTSDASVDTDPSAAWRDGTLWIAWESNQRGLAAQRDPPSSRRIFAVSLKDGKVSEPEPLSNDGISSYDPSIAALEDGRVCVAWHSFVDNNFDVYMRRRLPGDGWEPVRRLTRAPSIDRHAVLFARGAELWLAYENAQMTGYRIGNALNKRLVVARVGAEGLEAPKSSGKPSPLMKGGEAAAPVFDASGRLWVAFLRGLDRSWNVMLAGHDGRLWSDASPLTQLHIPDRAPSIAMASCEASIDGSRALVAFQADDTPSRYDNENESLKSKSDVYLVTRDLSSSPAASPMTLEPLAEDETPYEAGQMRVAFAEDAKTPSIEYKGQTLNLYYGDLHDHTEVSICGRIRDESIDEAYQDMRDITHLDFACVTDHGYNQNPYLWNHTAKLARINNDPGRFLSFLGEEWTSTFEEYSREHPYGFYGHRNLIFADPYLPRWWNERNRQTPAQVWEDLRKMKANFVQIPHQLADTGNVPIDWNYTDEVAQPVAEIFQSRGSYEYKGAPREAKRTTPTKYAFLQDAWARGIVIGVIASPDHGGGMGKACVYAPDLSREAILDALRARHCFGTTAAKIVLDVRVNGALMGEKIPAAGGKPVEVKIAVRCPGDIDRVEVCRSNEFIYSQQPGGRSAELTYLDESPLDGFSYYYIRVTQKDGEIAWSSPVWLGAK